MIDNYTLEKCKNDKEVLQLKINNLEHAIQQIESIISESREGGSTLIFLRRKIADAMHDLETLYLLKNEYEKSNET